MKHFYLKTLVLLLLAAVGQRASAYDCIVDGIAYNLNKSNNTASVAYFSSVSRKNRDYYKGEVVIPASFDYQESKYSVISIEDFAFRYCSGLTGITIPNSVTSIGKLAFDSCTGLTSVTIPNGVTSIGISAFNLCYGLTSVSIGNNVISIEDGAFNGCYRLTSVTIPNSVTSIGEFAFNGCLALTSITIPNSVTSIGYSAFSLTPWYGNQPDGLVYAGKVAYAYKGDMPFYSTIILDEGTLGIADRAFEDCVRMVDIIIPNSLTNIGNRAFEDCHELADITIPNSVANIGDKAFAECRKLTRVTIPNSVTSIGYAVFSGCTGLTSVVVEAGNSKYDSRGDCNAIIETASNTLIAGCKNTTIPNSVAAIGDYAFEECRGLTSIAIPNSVTSIGDLAFAGCSCKKLTSITIPNSVTSIGSNAFQGCSSLASVIIGSSVTSIGEDAFWGCSGLSHITSLATVPPACGKDTFDRVDKTACRLSVPSGSIEAYKAADVWKEFYNIDGEASGIHGVTSGAGKAAIKSIYDLNGRQQQGTHRGLNIVRMSDGTVRKVMVR